MPKDSTSSMSMTGRLRAALFCAAATWLSGCSTGDTSPLGASLGAIVSGGGNVATDAERIPYASLEVSTGGNQSLMVMAYRRGSDTYWQARDRATVVLREGRLDATSGFEQDLLGVKVEGQEASAELPWQNAATTPQRYRLTAQWQQQDSVRHSAVGAATLQCDTATQTVALSLTTRMLQRCIETVDWGRDGRTRNVFWRDPGDMRIWAATETPRPGGERFEWRIARPWWPAQMPPVPDQGS